MLGQRTSLNVFKKNGIILCIFSNHNRRKLEINGTRKVRKFKIMWKKGNWIALSWIITESKNKSKEKLEGILRKTKTKTQHAKTYGMQQK